MLSWRKDLALSYVEANLDDFLQLKEMGTSLEGRLLEHYVDSILVH